MRYARSRANARRWSLRAASVVGVADGVERVEWARGDPRFERSDLGWEARGWWQRYPQDIPYKLRHVDALFAEPLAVLGRDAEAVEVRVECPGHGVERRLDGRLVPDAHAVAGCAAPLMR